MKLLDFAVGPTTRILRCACEPSGSVPSLRKSTTDCSATRRARARSASVSSVIRPRTASASVRSASDQPFGSGVQSGSSRPSSESFWRSTRRRAVPHHSDRNPASLDLGKGARGTRRYRGQLHVDPGAERRHGRLTVGCGDTVEGFLRNVTPK